VTIVARQLPLRNLAVGATPASRTITRRTITRSAVRPRCIGSTVTIPHTALDVVAVASKIAKLFGIPFELSVRTTH
jgi:hypothetical protein